MILATHQPCSDRLDVPRITTAVIHTDWNSKVLQPLPVVSCFPRQGETSELAFNTQRHYCREFQYDSFTKRPVLHMTVSQLFTKQAFPDLAIQTLSLLLNNYMLLNRL